MWSTDSYFIVAGGEVGTQVADKPGSGIKHVHHAAALNGENGVGGEIISSKFNFVAPPPQPQSPRVALPDPLPLGCTAS